MFKGDWTMSSNINKTCLNEIGWYREVIDDYAKTVVSLTNLKKKDVPFILTQECQNESIHG